MRDIWDEKRKKGRPETERTHSSLSSTKGPFGKHAEEGLAKTRKYFLEHFELKKVAEDFFPDYQRYLGEGGFTPTP